MNNPDTKPQQPDEEKKEEEIEIVEYDPETCIPEGVYGLYVSGIKAEAEKHGITYGQVVEQALEKAESEGSFEHHPYYKAALEHLESQESEESTEEEK